MTTENIKKLIEQGEGIEVEFKKSTSELPGNIYETICAFLNRRGGHILLGVDDDGTLSGVNEPTINNQINILAKGLNNPQIINPTTYLSPLEIDVDNKKVLWIYVPEGSQAYSYKGVYYDRNDDGDFKLANKQLIAELYARKQSSFTENRVFPYLTMDDFEQEQFDLIRAIVGKEHIWDTMSNDEILTSARMKLKDAQTGKEGYTLAAAMLFGKDNTIASVLPHHKTDALCRKKNTELYDDRDDIRCNLLRSYYRLFAFIDKHLPEKPYIERTQRVSLITMVFREIIPNFLIHRELSSAVPATLTIYKDTVVIENANRPYNWGLLTPNNFRPYPKNPTIAAFFKQLGWVEELGYGVRNIYKYCPLLVEGALPIIEEKDLFKVTIQYEEGDGANDTIIRNDSVNDKVSDRVNIDTIFQIISKNGGLNTADIAKIINKSIPTINRYIKQLKDAEKIEFRGAPKTGGYYLKNYEKGDGTNDVIISNNRVNDRVSDSANDRVSDRVNVNTILQIISKKGGLNTADIAKIINKSIPTVNRYIKQLKDAEKIEFRGAPKTGGYYLKDK